MYGNWIPLQKQSYSTWCLLLNFLSGQPRFYPGCQRFLALGSQQLWLWPQNAGSEAGPRRETSGHVVSPIVLMGQSWAAFHPTSQILTLAVWLARWKACVSLMPLTDERTCTDKYYIHNSRKSKVWESTISRTLSFSTFWRKMSSWFSPLGRGSWSYFRRFPDLCAKLDERCIVGYHTKSILLVICLQHH